MKSNQSGYSLVEALITITLVSLAIVLISAFSVNVLYNYSINSARSNLLADANLTIDIINNDIRLSAFVDENNRWLDPHAPAAPADEFSWESTEEVLILATAAQDEAGNLLFSDPLNYVTEKNNHIYYVENGSLKRRVLASPVVENVTINTCPASQATELCPADSVLAEDVQDFTVAYIDQEGLPTTPDNARSVEVVLRLAADRFNQTISVSESTRMVFRNE